MSGAGGGELFDLLPLDYAWYQLLGEIVAIL